MSGPRWLYLHGFASGPESGKGVATAKHFEPLGIAIERLNLRVPSFEHLRLSEMIRVTRSAIGGERDRAVLFGSSLGGLTAARVAEVDPRVCALVLLAPAFRLAERWRKRLGEAGWSAWRDSGWYATEDYGGASASPPPVAGQSPAPPGSASASPPAEKRKSRVDFEFIREAGEIDERSNGWPDVRVPTLIIQGTRDDVVDPELSRTFARDKRHVRLVEVDDGHELISSIPTILRESEGFLARFLGSSEQH